MEGGEEGRRDGNAQISRLPDIESEKTQGRKRRHAPGNDASLPSSLNGAAKSRSQCLGRLCSGMDTSNKVSMYKGVCNTAAKHKWRRETVLKRMSEEIMNQRKREKEGIVGPLPSLGDMNRRAEFRAHGC